MKLRNFVLAVFALLLVVSTAFAQQIAPKLAVAPLQDPYDQLTPPDEMRVAEFIREQALLAVGDVIDVLDEQIIATTLGDVLEECTADMCELEVAQMLRAQYVLLTRYYVSEGERFVRAGFYDSVRERNVISVSARGATLTEIEAGLASALQPIWEHVRSAMTAAPEPERSRTGTLSIGETSPAGAEVAVDGDLAGTAPLELELAEGTHNVTFSAAGYDTVIRDAEIEAGETVDWTELTVLAPLPALVDATGGTPAEAAIYVNDELRGTASAPLALPPGQYNIRLQADGYVAETRQIDLAPGQSWTDLRGFTMTAVPVEVVTPRGGREQNELVEEPPARPDRERSGGSGKGLTTAGWVLASLGVAAIGSGVGFYFAAANQHDQFESATTESAWETHRDDGQTAATISTISYATGAALAGTGGVLLIVGSMKNGRDVEVGVSASSLRVRW